MHIFIECSIPLEGEDEGYGEKRICHDCAKNGNVQNNIDIQLDQENKENTPKKKKTYRPAAKYLGGRKNDIKDIGCYTVGQKSGHTNMIKKTATVVNNWHPYEINNKTVSREKYVRV